MTFIEFLWCTRFHLNSEQRNKINNDKYVRCGICFAEYLSEEQHEDEMNR